jgi:5-methyltetrahydrofolate--homocysteine methyltransferase
MQTRVSSPTREVIIGDDQPTVLIGERLNPTGKKKLAEALQNDDMEFIRKEALSQVQAGADILDVNCGVPGVDEVALLPRMVQAVTEVTDVPLCIDSSKPEALEAALDVYRGKPIVNSVNGGKSSLEKILPLVKKYGAAVIGLTMDEKGIPNNSDKRIAIAHRIVEWAETIGISRSDVIIDCLSMPLGVDSKAGLVTIETIRQVKAELGVNLTVGASNISMGLPDRHIINSAFLAVIIASGITCPIVDVAKVRPFILAVDLALGRDDHAMRYIRAYRQYQKQQKS